ncbi:amidohydrolase [Brevibacterium sp. R8603A2]|uniref:amidohydrolase n=1 Tax=Brevibacterium sp. R8603A2 TaxID=2929779 RepID=UPI001FF98821|nr:amidohydrolase [Brevibacterium sp. R8603A2]
MTVRIFANARVFEGDSFSPPRTVTVVDGRVRSIDEAAPDWTRADPDSRTVDLAGQYLLPGFIESHGHPAMLARTLLEVDVTPQSAGSIAAIQDAVAAAVQDPPADGWIRGAGWLEGYLDDRRVPTRQDLDAVAPDHPVVLIRGCRHIALANSKALELSGIDASTADPAGGRLVRDPDTGEPTGILQEAAQDLLQIPAYTPEMLERGFALAQAKFAEWGVTTVNDMSTGSAEMRLYTALNRADRLGVRVRPWLWALDQMGMKGLLSAAVGAGITSGLGDDMVRIQGMKFVLDGGVGGQTAALTCPYEHSDETGILYYDDEEITAAVRRALEHGLRPAIHGIGDAAIDQALRALEGTGLMGRVEEMRARIEHCTLPSDENLDALARHGIIAASSVGFVYHIGDSYLDVLGTERMERVYPHRTFIDRGIVAPGNSDVPVTNGNPWEGIYGAVTRKSSSGQVLDTVQNITVAEALAAYTSLAAYATFEEDTLGTIAVGAHADFGVYERSPFEVDVEELKDFTPTGVYLAGEPVSPN